MKKEVKYIVNKKIEVYLDSVEGKNQLIFKLTKGDAILNLETDDSDEIKELFLSLIQEIELNPIELELKTGENFNESENKLFLDASKEYINKLEEEISELENDENLKEIRVQNIHSKDEE